MSAVPADVVTDVRYHNAVESPRLIEHFVRHPPAGFRCSVLRDGTPLFFAPLDPLLTVDPATRRRLEAWPALWFLLRRVRLRACFAGTTVSEYAPLGRGSEPEALVRELLAAGRDEALVIVKDLPVRSPLVDDASNRHTARLADALRAHGFALVEGQALAWVPIDFASTDEYLARLSRGARRDIRRKLRARAHLSIEMHRSGDAALAQPALRGALYQLYRNVYAQSETHFDLLDRAFFDAVLMDPRLDGVLFLYRHEQRLIGFNLCVADGDRLVDKYVGFEYPAAREHSLYVVSWMHNLEYARARGFARYVAGWTDPAVKAHLGARFTVTRHAVRARNPLLRMFLRYYAHRFESDRAWLDEHATRGA
jgi:hypothetical protein